MAPSGVTTLQCRASKVSTFSNCTCQSHTPTHDNFIPKQIFQACSSSTRANIINGLHGGYIGNGSNFTSLKLNQVCRWVLLAMIYLALCCAADDPTKYPTSQPSSQPSVNPTLHGFAEVFDVLDLTSTNAISVDVTVQVGDFHGSMALSTDRVFLSGSKGTVGYPKNNLASSSPVIVTGENYTLVTNLATQQVYAVGDEVGKSLQGVGYFHCLIPLDADSALHANSLATFWLSEAVFVSVGSNLYSGYNRIVVVDGTSLESFAIQLQNGRVTEMDDIALSRQAMSNDRFQGGVLAYSFQQEDILMYATPAGATEHQHLNPTSAVTNRQQGVLGLSSSIALDATSANHNWYFYSEGGGSLLQTTKGVGRASYILLDSPPTSKPSAQPSSYPSYSGDEEGVFEIFTLGITNTITADVTAVIGERVNSLAISSQQVFIAGTNGTYGLLNASLSPVTVVKVTSTRWSATWPRSRCLLWATLTGRSWRAPASSAV